MACMAWLALSTLFLSHCCMAFYFGFSIQGCQAIQAAGAVNNEACLAFCLGILFSISVSVYCLYYNKRCYQLGKLEDLRSSLL